MVSAINYLTNFAKRRKRRIWSIHSGQHQPSANQMMTAFLLLCLVCPVISSLNNACDWTGSGLSVPRNEREIASIYLRCTAGTVTWNYPQGAVRILLKPQIHHADNFRACVKIHPVKHEKVRHHSHHHRHNKQVDRTDEQQRQRLNETDHKTGKYANIFLETTKRLIPLFRHNDNILVKCFRSIKHQVALYVEAADVPFENLNTIFEYNLEFINNKHNLLASSHFHKQSHDKVNEIHDDGGHKRNQLTDTNGNGNGWWNWLWQSKEINEFDNGAVRKKPRATLPLEQLAVDEEIVSELGQSWEVCRPCTDIEMIHAYCSSDIVLRGTINDVQDKPQLETIELTVKSIKILRDNLAASMNALNSWRYYYKTNKNLGKMNQPMEQYVGEMEVKTINSANESTDYSFHTPRHCSATHGEGEFVFIGRKRFDEIMVICVPRIQEWRHVAVRYNGTEKAPCILNA